jgi:hypothetical protein
MLAREAIALSVRQNRTVRILDPDGSQDIVLNELSEGESLTSEGVDYWGTRDDGGEWRVIIVGYDWIEEKLGNENLPARKID